jgi:AcrR family transcriptional regulator
MTAILDAATSLFAARGPASVSVRDIAAAAQVNHALVHRHFGSKADVLRAVLERAAQEMAAITAEEANSHRRIARLFAASAEHEMYWRALARAILDGENPQTLQREFPTIQRLIALLHAEQRQARQQASSLSSTDLPDARVVVGALSALTLGWLVFEPYLLEATGLAQHDPKEVRRQIVQMLQTLIDRALTA